MKKIKLTAMLLLLTPLAACDTGGLPKEYDPRGMVDESCEHLDNLDEHWQPVWCDEFDEDGLPDPARWGYDVGGGGWGNQELQYYTNANLNNAFIEDGILNIKAVPESHQGYDYTSARLVSKYRGDWEYARIQVKAKMPSGTGTWPAIWMLPTEWRYGGWPDSGEIDIMEYVGYDPGVVHGTIHTGAYNHMRNTQIGYTRNVPTAEDEFHLYEMIWEPARIILLIDGEMFAQFGYNPETNKLIENSDAWPFDQPFHLILNLAVGGTWGGQRGVDPAAFPTAMQVEYVRVYQKDYAAMSREAPSEVDNLRVHWRDHSSARIAWNHATHPVQVSHYEIFADNVLKGTTTLNAYNIRGLEHDSQIRIDVVAVDFAGNRSKATSLNIRTQSVRDISEPIPAASYDHMQGVTTEPAADADGSLIVSRIAGGDFLDFVLYVPERATYRIHYRIASPESGGEINLYGRGHLPLSSTSVPKTSDFQTWQTVTSDAFTLQEGVMTLRVYAENGGFNLNYIEFEKVG